MAIDESVFLSGYQKQVQDSVESRKIQKIWDAFIEQLEDVVREDIPFPAPLRTWDEDDMAQELSDYYVGQVLIQYAKEWIHQVEITERHMT